MVLNLGIADVRGSKFEDEEGSDRYRRATFEECIGRNRNLEMKLYAWR